MVYSCWRPASAANTRHCSASACGRNGCGRGSALAERFRLAATPSARSDPDQQSGLEQRKGHQAGDGETQRAIFAAEPAQSLLQAVNLVFLRSEEHTSELQSR